MDGGNELDGAGEGQFRRWGKGGADGGGEALEVDADVDEDVEGGEAGGGDRDEAGVAVVDEEVGLECGGSEVVEAAGAVGGVGEDEDVFGAGGGGAENVGEREGVHKEAIRELEGNTAGRRGDDAVDGLVDLEVVVEGEEGGGGFEGWVRQDLRRNLVLHVPLRGWLLLRCRLLAAIVGIRVRVWTGGER